MLRCHIDYSGRITPENVIKRVLDFFFYSITLQHEIFMIFIWFYIVLSDLQHSYTKHNNKQQTTYV